MKMGDVVIDAKGHKWRLLSCDKTDKELIWECMFLSSSSMIKKIREKELDLFQEYENTDSYKEMNLCIRKHPQ